MKTKILKNDTVKVITGKDKGKIAKVLKVFTKENKVIVEGVNMVTKHIKAKTGGKAGEKIQISQPIDLSNVMAYETKNKKASRVGFKIVKDEKVRIYKKSENQISK